MSIEEQAANILSHPLSLLLIGAAISGLLIPFFTNRWQIHQKGLEIRINLVGRISQTVMGMITAIESIVEGVPLSEIDKEYRRLKVKGAVIWAELESYFPNQDVGMLWYNLTKDIECFYKQTEKGYAATKSEEGMDKTDFEKKKSKFLTKKYDVMELVLNIPMVRFSLLPGFVVRSRLYQKSEERGYIDAGLGRREKKKGEKRT